MFTHYLLLSLSLSLSRTHACTHRYGRAGVMGMVCFLMTQAITKLSWQVILRQINASKFNTRRGLKGAGLSNDRNSFASFDRKTIFPTALFFQASLKKLIPLPSKISLSSS